MAPYDKNSDRHKLITSVIAQYITSGMVPIYSVDKSAFKKVVSTLDPRYKMPGRNHFTDKQIPRLYTTCQEEIVQELSSAQGISCTMDGWSSITKDPYMSLTAHFVDSNWQLQTRCLLTMYCPESHTGENLATFVRNGLSEYGMQLNAVVAMTTDGAANMVSACTKLECLRLGCFGHLLHNAVNSALDEDEIKASVVLARKIVSTFSYSFQHKQRFLKIQKELGLPQHGLINDVSTRWSSKYRMLSRLVEQLPAVNQLFTDDRKYRNLIPDYKSKDVMEVVVKVLEPFNMLTDLLSGEKVVTISSVLPLMTHVKELCSSIPDEENLNFDESQQELAYSIRTGILTYMMNRLSNENVNMFLAEACLLDPRYNIDDHHGVVGLEVEAIKTHVVTSAVALLTAELTEPSDAATTPTSASQSSQEKSLSSTGKSLASLLKRKKSEKPATTTQDRVERELQIYLEMCADDEDDPLQWWKKHSLQLPSLAKLSKRVLSVCATSVASERLFSLAGNIVTKKRSSLKPDMVNMLCTLAFNSKE